MQIKGTGWKSHKLLYASAAKQSSVNYLTSIPGERTVTSTNGPGKLDLHMLKNEKGYLLPNAKNQMRHQDLNPRPDMIKLLEENIEEALQHIGFLEKTHKNMQ